MMRIDLQCQKGGSLEYDSAEVSPRDKSVVRGCNGATVEVHW